MNGRRDKQDDTGAHRWQVDDYLCKEFVEYGGFRTPTVTCINHEGAIEFQEHRRCRFDRRERETTNQSAASKTDADNS